jgi:hypothetical protein
VAYQSELAQLNDSTAHTEAFEVHRLSNSEVKQLNEDMVQRYWLTIFVKKILEGEKTILRLFSMSTCLFALQNVPDDKQWMKRKSTNRLHRP